MEKFDFEVEEPVARVRRLPSFLDLLTVLVLLVTLAVGAFLLFVFINPADPLQSAVSEYPHGLRVSDCDRDADSNGGHLDSDLRQRHHHARPWRRRSPWSPRPPVVSLIPPSKTPEASPTSGPPYSANVSAIESTIIHPQSDCQWLGVGGSVVDKDNAPVLYLTLRLTGSLNDQPVEKLTVSGTAPDYGQAGFEFKLGTTPVDFNISSAAAARPERRPAGRRPHYHHLQGLQQEPDPGPLQEELIGWPSQGEYQGRQSACIEDPR